MQLDLSKIKSSIAYLNSVLVSVLVLFSIDAFSSGVYLDPLRILYERPPPSVQLDLIECFRNGNCKQDNKIRIYPMPCAGSGASDCTGCYRLQGGKPIRVGDLDSNGSCAGAGGVNEQRLRVFVGYEQSCPAGTPVGTVCTDGQLLLSCIVSSEGAAGVGDNILSYNRDCFSGRPYVRRARAAGVVTVLPSVLPAGPTGCAPGTMGIYPSCIPCSDTSYKFTTGSGACTECVPPMIANSMNVLPTTAGTTKTSVNDCRVADFTCANGYAKNSTAETCDSLPSPSPSPTPSPTPTSTPSQGPSAAGLPACEDANIVLTVTRLKPSTIIGGVDQKTGEADIAVTWSPSTLRTDFVVFSYDIPSRLGGVGMGPKASAKLYISYRAAGVYPVNIVFYHYQGRYCPVSIPFSVTIPAL